MLPGVLFYKPCINIKNECCDIHGYIGGCHCVLLSGMSLVRHQCSVYTHNLQHVTYTK